MIALLPQEHLVQIGLENLGLVVMQFQQPRHQGFVDFARQGALVAQVIILHQLLGQRAAALHGLPGADIGPERARDAPGVDAMVMLELPVLDRLETGDQQFRHVLQGDQRAVLVVLQGQSAAEMFRPASVTGSSNEREER